jgi:hypothetical protein
MILTTKKFMSSQPLSFGIIDVGHERGHEQTILYSLCSLVLRLISRGINKAAFDVSLSHGMFKWTNVV